MLSSSHISSGNPTNPSEDSMQGPPCAPSIENRTTDKMKGICGCFRRTKKTFKDALCCFTANTVLPDSLYEMECCPDTSYPRSDAADLQPGSSSLARPLIIISSQSGIEPPVRADPEPVPVPCSSNLSLAPESDSVSGPSNHPITPLSNPSIVEVTTEMGQNEQEPSPNPSPSDQKAISASPEITPQLNPSSSGTGPVDEQEGSSIWVFMLQIWMLLKLAVHDLLGYFTVDLVSHGSESPTPPTMPSQQHGLSTNPPDLKGTFNHLYSLSTELGSGAYGCVYEGTRRSDGEKVAVKFVRKTFLDHVVLLPSHSKPVQLEVAVNLELLKHPTSPHVVKMLDWFEKPQGYIIIMEYPRPCMTLFDFVRDNGGRLEENLARSLFHQAVLAVQHCHQQGVYHGDVSADNVLINTETLQLKLIDFGCGGFLRDTEVKRSLDVWGLGVLLCSMVTRRMTVQYWPLSKECLDLINWCMEKETLRPTLDQVKMHKWYIKD